MNDNDPNQPPANPMQPPQADQPQAQYPQQQPSAGYTPPPQYPQQPMAGYEQPPQYPYQQPPQQASAKKGSGKKILLIIGGIVLVLILGCAALFGTAIFAAFNLTQPAADAGDKFMTALRDGNYDQAFTLSTAELQKEVTDAQGLKSALESRQPTKWTFTSRNVNNNEATLTGSATFVGGTEGTVSMVLNKVGNDWKVAGVDLK